MKDQISYFVNFVARSTLLHSLKDISRCIGEFLRKNYPLSKNFTGESVKGRALERNLTRLSVEKSRAFMTKYQNICTLQLSLTILARRGILPWGKQALLINF
jgi:hypothetical protein